MLSGLCDWSQAGELKWERGTGRSTTAAGDQAPDHDHTTKSEYGGFLYLDSRSSQAGRTARLQSRDQEASLCLSLWYYSQNSNGFLRVLQLWETEDGEAAERQVWEAPKFSLPSWQYQVVSVHLTTEMHYRYQLQLAGTVGTNNQSITALDDIAMEHGKCKENECNFERGDCGYGNFRTDSFDWG